MFIESYKIQQYIEIRCNGRLSLDAPMEIGSKGQCKQLRKKLNLYLKKGYTKVKSQISPNQGRYILLSKDGLKAICISYRLHLNMKDRNGHRIYNDSKLARVVNISYEREFNEWRIIRDPKHKDTRIYLSSLIGQNPSGRDVWKSFPIKNSDFFDEFVVIK